MGENFKLMIGGEVVECSCLQLNVSADNISDSDFEPYKWQPFEKTWDIECGGLVAPMGEDLDNIFGNDIDIVISSYPGKLPRKMKKALRSDWMHLDTKWKRKVFNYMRRNTYRANNAEVVVTKQDLATIEAQINFAKMERECDTTN